MNLKYKTSNRQTGIILTLVMIMFGFAISVQAQTISGKITDTNTGDFLPGANVMLVGTNYGAASDRSGDFEILNVPAGDYTLSVQYIGYEDYSEEINVSADNHFEIALQVSFVAMGEVVVAGLRHGEAKALNLQKTSNSISNVVVAEQIEAFPDPNAAEALRRLPGVSIQQDQGEGRYVLIRGTAARLNTTRINGNTIPSPEDDNRNVQLDVIPSDLLGAIEISKALTPDMDADAIGGSVNLITKNAFDYDGQVLKVDIGGGYKNLRGDLNKKATFTYGNQFMDGKLGLLIGGSYNNSDMATDNIEIKWNDEYEWVTDEIDEIDDGDIIYETDAEDAKVLDEFEWRGYELNRTRIGLNLNLDYKLNNNSLIYLRFLNNSFTDYEFRHLMNFDFGKSVDDEEPGTGYTDANSVVAAPVVRELKDRKQEATIQSIAVGGKHKFGQIDVDYNFSTSLAKEVNEPSRDVVFEQEGFNFDYNISDPDFPTINVTNGANYNDMSEFEFDEMEYKDGETAEDRDYTGALNIQLPYSFGDVNGKLKFGGKMRIKNKISDKTAEKVYGWDGDDDLMGTDFETEIDGSDFMDGHYEHEVGIDADKFADFWEDNIDQFESEPGYEANYYETWEADEDIMAFYAMTNLKFDKFTILAGARVENTSTSYQGWEGDLALVEDGEAEMEEVLGENDYTNVLPMVHLRYDVNDKLVARAAFTQSLARPDYVTLVPFQKFDDGELEQGNPGLLPTVSTNFDLMVEYYIGKLGIISGGFFTKTMSDYIYNKVEEPEDMPFGDEEVDELIYPLNGEDATLSGIELQWYQALTFLPAPFDGLGIYLNYTNTTSEAKYEDRDPTTLPGQASNIGNIGLSYEKSGFAAKISANFHGEYIDEIGDDEDEDVYYADNLQLDVSASYTMKNNIKIYMDATNLTNSPLLYYEGDSEFPIQREFYSFGVRAGVKVDF